MRTPRRSFAAPFVITVVGAAGASGFTSCNPPAQQRPPDPLIGKNPPAPEPTPEPTQTGPAGNRWTVTKQGDKCVAMAKIECPQPATPGGPVPTCNPPPPIDYACPTGLAMERPIEIVQWPSGTECSIVQPPINCPANAACNPPPPQMVTCPSR